MNFLNPSILFGLAAAALPVIIHLLSRRRARDVTFSSIEFLEHMKTDRMRRIRLKQILLILLRTLAIILIVLAFARPAVNSSFRQNARTSAVVIVDGSASMMYVHNGESLFATAVRTAKSVLEMLDDKDMAGVVLSVDPPASLEPGMTTNARALFDALGTAECGWGENDATRAFAMAIEMLSASTDPNREIYYITDNAANALPDSLPPIDRPVRLYIVQAGPERRGGSVVTDVEPSDRLITAGTPVNFRVRGMLGPEERDMSVEFFAEGKRKGRTTIGRHAGDTVETTFDYTPESPGWYSLRAFVDDGRYGPGETRRLVVRVPERVHVLLVGGTPEDGYFLEKALLPDPERSPFVLGKTTGDRLRREDISQADVVVLAGVSTLPSSIYDSLVTAIVERGAGLVVFAPEEMSEILYKDGLFRDVIPVRIEGRVALRESYTLIDRFDMSHPILKDISRDGGFHKPRVTMHVKFRPAGTILVFARFGDGSPAAVSAVCGKGRAVLFAVDASQKGSELPLTGVFPPMFVRTVQYLSDSGVLGGRYETGEPVTEPVGDLHGNAQVVVKPREGPARSVETVRTQHGVVLSGVTAEKPGFYSVFVGEEERSRFCVNVPHSELIYTRAGTEQASEAFKDMEWSVIDAAGNVTDQITGNRYGTELFGLFLLLAGIVLLAEMLISRKA